MARVQVRAADSAAEHFDAHLAARGHRLGQVDDRSSACLQATALISTQVNATGRVKATVSGTDSTGSSNPKAPDSLIP